MSPSFRIQSVLLASAILAGSVAGQIAPKATAPSAAMTLDETLADEGVRALAMGVADPPDDPMQLYRTVELGGRRLAVVQGDLLLEDDELRVYDFMSRLQLAQYHVAQAAENFDVGPSGASIATAALAADADSKGAVRRWKPGKVLTYAVLRNSFASEGEYETVARNMEHATQDWQGVCGVAFEHLQVHDAAADLATSDCTFVVTRVDTHGAFIAAAFFPGDKPERRVLYVDPSYFTSDFDQVGVLRHELGHVLGFRHEHIRSGAPSACPGEPLAGVAPLTDYDPRSVMHYFCGGSGTREMALTELDIVGSRAVYGPPLGQFEFVE